MTTRADDESWIYIDGQLIVYNTVYFQTVTVIVPYTATVVAIQVFDTGGGWGGLLGSFSDGDVTDASWKCTKTYSDGWNKSIFDDSAWPAAHAMIMNGDPSSPWPSATNIASNAKWIWAGSYQSPTTSIVYCRKLLGMSSL